jgi:hypothetical protein
LAPFNSTQTDKSEASFISPEEIVPKSIVKFKAKVREVDRQFERNNNCEVDNGVYNKEDVDVQAGDKNAQFDPLALSDQEKVDSGNNSPTDNDNSNRPKKKCIAKITEINQLKIGITLNR